MQSFMILYKTFFFKFSKFSQLYPRVLQKEYWREKWEMHFRFLCQILKLVTFVQLLDVTPVREKSKPTT